MALRHATLPLLLNHCDSLICEATLSRIECRCFARPVEQIESDLRMESEFDIVAQFFGLSPYQNTKKLFFHETSLMVVRETDQLVGDQTDAEDVRRGDGRSEGRVR